ncbi:MAG TPA: DUF6188 family protein [Gaiellaceae bacterium]|nr:DUF6188 family protein [Gaiellaceae bacterium]
MDGSAFASIAGMSVEQIWVWGPIRLVLDIGSGAPPATYVDVNDAVLVKPDGTEVEIDAFGRPGEAGGVLALLNDRVEVAENLAGTLRLVFASGTQLRARPDDHYESWKIVAEGRTFQCLPGGEVGSF